MQCVNCGFENAPGLTSCSRCASPMNLAGVDVEPPRRPRGAWGAFTRPFRAIRDSVNRSLHERTAWRPPPVVTSAISIFFGSLIPGLGHLRRGRWIQGLLIFIAWLGAAFLAVSNAGSAGGWLYYALLLSVHCMAIGLLLAPVLNNERVIVRIGLGLGVFAVLHLVVYGSIRRVAGMYARAIELPYIAHATPSVTGGDIVLIQGRQLRPATFQRGDIVAYDIAQTWTNNAYVARGTGIDRIVGLAGDRLKIVKGQVYVNDQPLPENLAPLAATAGFPDISDIRAAEGEYLIVPSTLDMHMHGDARQGYINLMMIVMKVRHDDVQGKIFWRIRPLDRWGPVN